MTRTGKTRLWAAALALGVGLGLAAGCNKEKKSTENSGPPPGVTPGGGPPGGGPPGASSPQEVLAKLPGGEEFAAGKKVYADNNCARCHKLGDTGGAPPMPGPPGPPGRPAGGSSGGPPGGFPGGMGAGPDLTKVGAAPEHTKEWLAEHIRDAKKHKPESRMPAFGPDKIGDADLAKLVEYLASRK